MIKKFENFQTTEIMLNLLDYNEIKWIHTAMIAAISKSTIRKLH